MLRGPSPGLPLLDTQSGWLLKALEADQFQFAIHHSVQVVWRDRFLLQHEEKGIEWMRGLERRTTSEQFVEDCTE